MTLLKDDEWGAWSDREIARRCGVSATLANECRRSLQETRSDNAEPALRTYITKHGTEALRMLREVAKHQGERADLDNNVIDVEVVQGNSRSYTLDRLHREAPELYAAT